MFDNWQAGTDKSTVVTAIRQESIRQNLKLVIYDQVDNRPLRALYNTIIQV